MLSIPVNDATIAIKTGERETREKKCPCAQYSMSEHGLTGETLGAVRELPRAKRNIGKKIKK